MPVRPARPSDRAALSRLQSHLPEPSPSLLAAGNEVGTLLVSTDGDGPADRPVGYLLAVDSADGGHVAELVVAPAHRREGRASELLTAYLRERPAGTRVTLTVAPDNEAARSLYEAHGFEVAGRRRDFFESGDAVVYERTV
ncbi:GNAT family N-acetyltransferase [Halopelagius longus]|uniref:N-acetyltransferase n=1 Tax=Halopelagius longus TaxID=1236180 RepID=A0A1H0Y8Q8_9EURY|nr:N-acetyltransferase [Halopelagius longus]RDI72345.1 N-acetyltransferase [Halopelagius longus]SDQ11518.1 ribosomal-protein-alanine N-acetyltransferase [Halopelagius longus]